jgi:hypothetical protein
MKTVFDDWQQKNFIFLTLEKVREKSVQVNLVREFQFRANCVKKSLKSQKRSFFTPSKTTEQLGKNLQIVLLACLPDQQHSTFYRDKFDAVAEKQFSFHNFVVNVAKEKLLDFFPLWKILT